MPVGISLIPGCSPCQGGTEGFVAEVSPSSALCEGAAEPPGCAVHPLTPFERFHLKGSRISQHPHTANFPLLCSFDVASAAGNL